MDYVTIKWLHVLSSTILFGTGIGSAYYLLAATLQSDARSVFQVVRHVVLADWLFTMPAVIAQPLSGFYLVHLSGVPISTPWIAWSFALYLIAVACWLPVIWLQIRMRDLARGAADSGSALPPRYWRCFRMWVSLGIVAFCALVAAFYLMVAKPAL